MPADRDGLGHGGQDAADHGGRLWPGPPLRAAVRRASLRRGTRACPRRGRHAAAAGRAPRRSLSVSSEPSDESTVSKRSIRMAATEKASRLRAACLTAWPTRSSQERPVREAGHRVVEQQVADLVLAVLLPGAVDDDAGRPDDVSVGVVSRRHLEGQPELPAGAGRVGAFEEALVALDGRLDRLEELVASVERRDWTCRGSRRPARR